MDTLQWNNKQRHILIDIKQAVSLDKSNEYRAYVKVSATPSDEQTDVLFDSQKQKAKSEKFENVRPQSDAIFG